MDEQRYWESICKTKAPDAVSWYRPHLEKSLELNTRSAGASSATIIDVGGGESMLVADITLVDLPAQHYDVWHDRAVFHFLTAPEQRAAYVRQVAHAMKPGGNVIVATFGPDGPKNCSGLDIVRYNAESLHGQFGVRFRLVECTTELHQTPFGTTRQFLYCYCKVE
jgi:SAM-dependent methyltransferase